ncbi:MAG: hypothetical protein QNJ38_21840 [Prochloraceae cyanobacterium]|nr:hypothetical protein [Prochloraceae cyanobacterium]
MPEISINFRAYESIYIEISDEELKQLEDGEDLSSEMIEKAENEIYEQHPSIESWELDPDNPYEEW